MIYRFDIRYPANRGGCGSKFRLMITEDGHAIDTTFVSDKPTMNSLRTHLADKGFEAYGDMLNMSDGTIRTMVRRIA